MKLDERFTHVRYRILLLPSLSSTSNVYRMLLQEQTYLNLVIKFSIPLNLLPLFLPNTTPPLVAFMGQETLIISKENTQKDFVIIVRCLVIP